MSFSIIIPSKSASNLVPCIRAIREAGEMARIIVVDDGVDWDRVEADTRSFYADTERAGATPYSWLPLSIEKGAKPFVFARNANVGVQEAGEDDVILLNDDALLKTPGGFTALAHATQVLGYGLAAAACNAVGNTRQFQHNTGAMRSEPRMVCFVCVYIPRSTINAVGLLDERFVDYGLDDDDYCLRARNAGLKLGIFDGCYVDHTSLRSSFRGAAGAGGDFSANMRLFIEKWGVDNWNNPRSRSRFAALFPWPRCEEIFHMARCTLKSGHDDDHNFYPGPLPEAA